MSNHHRSQHEIAQYYLTHSLSESQAYFHVGVETIRFSFIAEYGMSKKEYFYQQRQRQQRQRQRSNRYQIIADYYLTHSLAETQAAFRIAHRSLITHYFRRAYGISRQEYLTAPR